MGLLMQRVFKARRPAPVLPDLAGMTIKQVLAAVDAGELTAAEAIAAEEADRGRVTLLDALRSR